VSPHGARRRSGLTQRRKVAHSSSVGILTVHRSHHSNVRMAEREGYPAVRTAGWSALGLTQQTVSLHAALVHLKGLNKVANGHL